MENVHIIKFEYDSSLTCRVNGVLLYFHLEHILPVYALRKTMQFLWEIHYLQNLFLTKYLEWKEEQEKESEHNDNENINLNSEKKWNWQIWNNLQRCNKTDYV